MISPAYYLFAFGILLAMLYGAIALGIIYVRWDRRRNEGFSFGQCITTTPLSKVQLQLMVGILGLTYFHIVLISQILKHYGVLSTEKHTLIAVLTGQILFYATLIATLQFFLKKNFLPWSIAFGFKATSLGNIFLCAILSLGAVLIFTTSLNILTAIIFSKLNVLFPELDLKMTPQEIIKIFKTIEDPWLLLGLSLFATIGAPITEELFFRGILYPFFKNRFGFLPATCLSAALFSFFHLNLTSFLPLFGLGIAFVLIYEWRGNLLASILLHAAYNSFSLCVLLIGKHVPLPPQILD